MDGIWGYCIPPTTSSFAARGRDGRSVRRKESYSGFRSATRADIFAVTTDGSVRPGRQYAERLGLYYRVRSSAEINWLFQRNIQFLEDYLRTPPEVGSLSRQRVLAQVAARPGCLLGDLFRVTDGEVSRDEVYSLIAGGDIFVDLQSALLPEPEKVRVSLEKSLCRDDGQAGSPAAHSRCGTDNNTSQIQRCLLLASEADLAEATRRFHIVSRALRGERHDPVPCRTLRRWIAGYRAARLSSRAAI